MPGPALAGGATKRAKVQEPRADEEVLAAAIDVLLRDGNCSTLSIRSATRKLEAQLKPDEPSGWLKPQKPFIRDTVDTTMARIELERAAVPKVKPPPPPLPDDLLTVLLQHALMRYIVGGATWPRNLTDEWDQVGGFGYSVEDVAPAWRAYVTLCSVARRWRALAHEIATNARAKALAKQISPDNYVFAVIYQRERQELPPDAARFWRTKNIEAIPKEGLLHVLSTTLPEAMRQATSGTKPYCYDMRKVARWETIVPPRAAVLSPDEPVYVQNAFSSSSDARQYVGHVVRPFSEEEIQQRAAIGRPVGPTEKKRILVIEDGDVWRDTCGEVIKIKGDDLELECYIHQFLCVATLQGVDRCRDFMNKHFMGGQQCNKPPTFFTEGQPMHDERGGAPAVPRAASGSV